MAKTKKQITGALGEDFSCQHLIDNGFEILEKNYRYKRAEVDIIASRENVLVFIEVKTRKNDRYGNPEEFVSDRKKELFSIASEMYVEHINWKGNIRFDVIALTKNKDSFDLVHLEDAFY